jgi:hypothetical protein
MPHKADVRSTAIDGALAEAAQAEDAADAAVADGSISPRDKDTILKLELKLTNEVPRVLPQLVFDPRPIYEIEVPSGWSPGEAAAVKAARIKSLARQLLNLVKEAYRRAFERSIGPIAGADAQPGSSGTPDPYTTGFGQGRNASLPFNPHLPGEGAQLGLNLGGMKGGGGQSGGFGGGGVGGGAGSDGFGATFGSTEGQAAKGSTFNAGLGADPGGAPSPGPDPHAGQVFNPMTGQWDTPESLPASPTDPAPQTQTPTNDNNNDKNDDNNQDENTGQEDSEAQEEMDENDQILEYLDTGHSTSSPNPDDGTDETGAMKGLPRRRHRRADRFTNQGFAPAQTSAVFKLLEYATGYIGDDGGGVNPRFFGDDPSQSASTSRSGRVADPAEGSDDGGGAIGGGMEDASSPFGAFGGGAPGADSDDGGLGSNDPNADDGSVTVTASGPDPDNEWGAGGYNPHYQPQGGYTWTPSSRGVVGTTRVAPARVQIAPSIRFK